MQPCLTTYLKSYPTIYPILTYPIPSYPILSYLIPSYSTLPDSTLSHLILSYPTLPDLYPTLSYSTPSYPIPSHLILSCPIQLSCSLQAFPLSCYALLPYFTTQLKKFPLLHVVNTWSQSLGRKMRVPICQSFLCARPNTRKFYGYIR